VKLRSAIILIVLLIAADQALKFYIKLSYPIGQSTPVFGNWFQLHFIENHGAAWGASIGGKYGKLLLSLFRLFAVFFGAYYIGRIVREKAHWGYIVAVSLIFAGALGNLIDSAFYGLIFDKGMVYNAATDSWENYTGTAKLVMKGGYQTFLHGHVVDMLHFDLFSATWPSWMPFVGGDHFRFFAPVFNIADACISIGVFVVLFGQGKFFKPKEANPIPIAETKAKVDDSAQIL
jgi:signal peptidase II